MSDDNPRLKLATVAKEPGIADLPLRVRGKFAKAVIAERKGDYVEAERLLNEAVAEETDHG